jgi:hypothetical protein
MEIEPNTDKDKIDVIVYNKGSIQCVIQIKTTVNSYEKSDLITWIQDMIADINFAPMYKLVALGNLKRGADDFCTAVRRYNEGARESVSVIKDLGDFKNILDKSNIIIRILPNSSDYIENDILINVAKLYPQYMDQISVDKMQSICKEIIGSVFTMSIKNTQISKEDIDNIVFKHRNLLTLTNDFAILIDSIKDKQPNNIMFHYLDDRIGFYGRKREISKLDSFINDTSPFLFYSIIGKGGIGKSKFIYNYIRNLNKNKNWKAVFLNKDNIENINTLNNFYYPQNLVLIIEYAGTIAEALGKLILKLSYIKHESMPEKLRILFVEREGYYEKKDTFANYFQYAGWYDKILGEGERRINILSYCYSDKESKDNSGFLEFNNLDDEDLKSIIYDYVKIKNITINDKMVQDIINKVKNFDEKGENKTIIRPLILLLVTAVYLERPYSIESTLDTILKDYIAKYKKHLLETLCNYDKEIFYALERIVIYSTSISEWRLGEKLVGSFEQASILINNFDDYIRYDIIFGSINEIGVCDYKIYPIKPDIIGEYYVIDYFVGQMRNETKLKEIIYELWDYPDEFCVFLEKCIDDLISIERFKSFFLTVVDLVMDIKSNLLSVYKWRILTSFKAKLDPNSFFRIYDYMKKLYIIDNISNENFKSYIGWLYELTHYNIENDEYSFYLLKIIVEKYNNKIPEDYVTIFCSCFFNLHSRCKSKESNEKINKYVKFFLKKENIALCECLLSILTNPIFSYMNEEGLIYWCRLAFLIIMAHRHNLNNNIIENYYNIKKNLISSNNFKILMDLKNEFINAKTNFDMDTNVYNICGEALNELNNKINNINGIYNRDDIYIKIHIEEDGDIGIRLFNTNNHAFNISENDELNLSFNLGVSLTVIVQDEKLSGHYIKVNGELDFLSE